MCMMQAFRAELVMEKEQTTKLSKAATALEVSACSYVGYTCSMSNQEQIAPIAEVRQDFCLVAGA